MSLLELSRYLLSINILPQEENLMYKDLKTKKTRERRKLLWWGGGQKKKLLKLITNVNDRHSSKRKLSSSGIGLNGDSNPDLCDAGIHV